jgi:hypothetical protein
MPQRPVVEDVTTLGQLATDECQEVHNPKATNASAWLTRREQSPKWLEGTSNNDGFFVDRSLAWRTGDFGS